MVALHFSLINFVDRASIGHLCCKVFYDDGGYTYNFYRALFVGVANTSMGMVVRWIDVEGMIVKAPWINTSL